jgi:protein TonB
MRIYLLAFFVFLFAFHIHAQTDTTAYLETDTLHVDTPPQFDGGAAGFAQFLGTHLKMPNDNIGGTVYFEFIIEKNGSLTNIRILNGVSPAYDKAVIDVLSQSPRWKPGFKKSIPVRVKKTASLGRSITETSEITTKKKRR